MALSDWLPNECTLWQTTPMYWQLVAGLELAKGKFDITDRDSCVAAGHQVADTIGVGQIVTNSLVKCACKFVYGKGESAPPPPPPQWHDWVGLSGQIQGTIGATITPNKSTDLYVRGMDDKLWQKYYTNSAWSDWAQVDNQLTMASSPTVVSNDNYRGVFTTGQDGQVYIRWWDGQWHDWVGLGGEIKGTVGATRTPEGVIDLYVQGMDDKLWQKYFANSAWSDWIQVDNQFSMASSPTVVSDDNYRGVFTTGQDGQVYVKYWG